MLDELAEELLVLKSVVSKTKNENFKRPNCLTIDRVREELVLLRKKNIPAFCSESNSKKQKCLTEDKIDRQYNPVPVNEEIDEDIDNNSDSSNNLQNDRLPQSPSMQSADSSSAQRDDLQMSENEESVPQLKANSTEPCDINSVTVFGNHTNFWRQYWYDKILRGEVCQNNLNAGGNDSVIDPPLVETHNQQSNLNERKECSSGVKLNNDQQPLFSSDYAELFNSDLFHNTIKSCLNTGGCECDSICSTDQIKILGNHIPVQSLGKIPIGSCNSSDVTNESDQLINDNDDFQYSEKQEEDIKMQMFFQIYQIICLKNFNNFFHDVVDNDDDFIGWIFNMFKPQVVESVDKNSENFECQVKNKAKSDDDYEDNGDLLGWIYDPDDNTYIACMTNKLNENTTCSFETGDGKETVYKNRSDISEKYHTDCMIRDGFSELLISSTNLSKNYSKCSSNLNSVANNKLLKVENYTSDLRTAKLCLLFGIKPCVVLLKRLCL